MHARLVTCLLLSLSCTSAYFRGSSVATKSYLSHSCFRKATYASIPALLKMSQNEVDAGKYLMLNTAKII